MSGGEENRGALARNLYFCLQTVAAAAVAIVLVFLFLGRLTPVDGISMVPTLRDKDMMAVWSLGYEPAQGDVVVLHKPSEVAEGPIVKRVIATAGQTVEIDYAAGVVRVDGQVLVEPYKNGPMQRPADPYRTIETATVPQGSIFVMGDNRNISGDSRDYRLGTIDTRYVIGRAVWVLFPFGNFGKIG